MLLNDIISDIKDKFDIVLSKFDIDTREKELSILNTRLEELDWKSNREESISLFAKQSILSKRIAKFKDISDEYFFFCELNDEDLKDEYDKVVELKKKIDSFYINLLFSEEDNRSCFLHLQSGAGGVESCDWVSILFRMYTRFFEKEGLRYDVVFLSHGEEAGYKSCILHVKGENVYGLLKNEMGVHRLVRISPFNAAGKRMTSFASVLCYPEVEKSKVVIDPKDLRIDTFKSSGAGGQHVNTTDSAVRITHLPTKIVVQSQNQRSQHQNKDTCMKMLYSRLSAKYEEDSKQDNDIDKSNIGWGSQIRSYVLQPYKMVKDLRSNYETSNADMFLNGDMKKCILSLLRGDK